jgi:hypothetical protein
MTGAPVAQPAGPPRSVADRLTGVARAYGGVLGSRTYFLSGWANFGSSFGDTLHYIALVVLVFQLTGQGIAASCCGSEASSSGSGCGCR